MQVQTSFDPAVQLTPPPIDTPIITYTLAGRNDSAVFVPDSSYMYQLSGMNTVENDVYTFTVTVTNAAGPSSQVSEGVVGKL